MEKLLYNYHTHTYRCGHASGTDEEFVKAAIAKGVKVLGFSDHFPFPGIVMQGIRPVTSQIDDYVESINYLKEKYKDQIEIHVGYEAEYFPEFDYWYREFLDSGKVEYLILGQHCLYENGELRWFHYDHATNVKKMVDCIVAGIKSGLFKYVCHPDFFMGEWNEATIKEYRRLIEKAVEYDIPIEINLNGIRKFYPRDPNDPKKFVMRYDDGPKYPYLKFWELASEYNVRVILGGDYHFPEEFSLDCESDGYEIVKMYHLNLIDRIDL